jgi:hypothetical protein
METWMDIVGEAREMFARGEPWWPSLLVRALDARRPGLGYEWVERCVRLLLPLVETDARESLLADVDALAGFRQAGMSRDEFIERARAIWYKPPSRDAARTAVAKLYEAASVVAEPRLPRYANRMAAPINNFLWAVSDPQSQFEVVLREFAGLAAEYGVVKD